MNWSSIEALLGRLIDDQITIDDIIVYAIVGGAVIGIFATASDILAAASARTGRDHRNIERGSDGGDPRRSKINTDARNPRSGYIHHP